MDDIEALLTDLRSFYASLAELQALSGPEFLLDGRVEHYHQALESAYATYGRSKQ